MDHKKAPKVTLEKNSNYTRFRPETIEESEIDGYKLSDESHYDFLKAHSN